MPAVCRGPSSAPPSPGLPGGGSDHSHDLRPPVPTSGAAPGASATTPLLSRQDLTLLSLIAGGLQVDVVARRLGVSERTLRRRMRRVCDRIGVNAPIEAVVWAVRRGLI